MFSWCSWVYFEMLFRTTYAFHFLSSCMFCWCKERYVRKRTHRAHRSWFSFTLANVLQRTITIWPFYLIKVKTFRPHALLEMTKFNKQTGRKLDFLVPIRILVRQWIQILISKARQKNTRPSSHLSWRSSGSTLGFFVDFFIVREIDCGNSLARGYMPAHQHCDLFYPLIGDLIGSTINSVVGNALVLQSGTGSWVLSG